MMFSFAYKQNTTRRMIHRATTSVACTGVRFGPSEGDLHHTQCKLSFHVHIIGHKDH